MELINGTRLTAGYSMAVEPSGRELLVVVVKGTFVLPKNGEPVRFHDEQAALNMADTFTAEPGFSSPLYEADFAPRKPFCDVLLVGTARVPDGREVTRLAVGMRVGPINKAFEVVGDRVWQLGLGGLTASSPKRFTEVYVSYDTAFGGTQRSSDGDPQGAYPANPVGRGWGRDSKVTEGTPLPNTEEIGNPISRPNGNYRPIALGPIARSWPERARFAGTYDQKWLDEEYPFLPSDFDERHFQAAPADQQMPWPNAPVDVALHGFTADGPRRFALPYTRMPVYAFPKRGGREDLVASMDTVVFEPDLERFTMTWRATRPIRRSMHEIGQILVGARSEEWWWKHEEARMILMSQLAT